MQTQYVEGRRAGNTASFIPNKHCYGEGKATQSFWPHIVDSMCMQIHEPLPKFIQSILSAIQPNFQSSAETGFYFPQRGDNFFPTR